MLLLIYFRKKYLTKDHASVLEHNIMYCTFNPSEMKNDFVILHISRRIWATPNPSQGKRIIISLVFINTFLV